MDAPEKDLTTGTNGAVVRQVQAERAARALTVAQLAARSGIPKRTLTRYLHFQRDFPLSALDKIAEGLDIDGDLLLRRARERSREE